MFSFAFLVGIYSFGILALGISTQLHRENVLAISIIFLLTLIVLLLKLFKKTEFKREIKKALRPKLNLTIFILIIFQATVNLIGVLGPEISFDALWYHLTLPKIFLQNHAIFHIPGGLLYYSDLPKLAETLYIPALSSSDEILAKLIHFLFGIFSAYATYKISRKYLDYKYSLLAVLIFYSNLVVGWLSISGYVDLVRTFFEIIAFWAFLEWVETKKINWLIESGIFVGLSISTKLTGFISLFIYVFFLLYVLRKKGIADKLKKLFTFIALSIIIPLPYFVLSFLNTGNPIFPLFSKILPLNTQLNFLKSLKDSFILLTSSPDPISPIYLISLPLIVIFFKKISFSAKIIITYCLSAFVLVIFLPIGDKARFFLPYLPALSIGITIVFSKLDKSTIQKTVFFAAIILSFISIGYRLAANYKYIPYLFESETKAEFLAKNLNFSFGDFYDTDGFLGKKINSSDKALLFGFHNLYYINFPFIDSSFVKKGDSFNYILTQNSEIPDQFKYWRLVYSNPLTKVNLYSLGGIWWVY
ncbi:MAG: hypothetical protein A2W22_03900 [Candidatus Levybacteria bacterium RBG_16_35_11]|nr:MAG: hypothetical protein A2W22_03900 [Candidatus Levybacteria bacterium RBG_16_35_11]